MLRRSTHPLRAALLALWLLVATSCGGGDAKDFCELLAETGATDTAADPEAAVALMREMRDRAPAGLRADVEMLLGVTEQMAEVDESDEEAVSALFELVLDPEVMAAGQRLEAYGVEECGLDPEQIGGGGDNLDEMGDDPAVP